MYPTKRWRRTQEIIQHYWQRWMREWLPSLIQRKKWKEEKKDVEINDIVLVISPETDRGKWPLGRITEVFRNQDGHVRKVKLVMGNKIYIRSIGQVCPLEIAA